MVWQTTESTPTYLESGRCWRGLRVSLVQWDNSNNVLSIWLDPGQRVEVDVTTDLLGLYITT